MFEAAEGDRLAPTEDLEHLDTFLLTSNNNDDDHTEPVEAEDPLVVSLASNLTLEEALNLHQTLFAESPGTPLVQFSLNLSSRT